VQIAAPVLEIIYVIYVHNYVKENPLEYSEVCGFVEVCDIK
jgi:hypothetical protein